MANGSSLPYRLRPNKAVDRELFLALLTRLAASLKLENYQYIGLGGPFLEDFRLIHGRLGIKSMVCIESEESVHKRQLFNRPVEYIQCLHSSLEDYIDSNVFETPVILWLDYTAPKQITDQIERFARTLGEVAVGSILRITLNANPSSLGEPDKEEVAVEIDELSADLGRKPTIQEWRLERFKERMGALFPSGLKPKEMTFKNYGRSVLQALRLSVEKEVLSYKDRRVMWALATHYADGQPMVTATIIVAPQDESEADKIVQDWEFRSTPDAPHLLDMPSLSTAERLKMESNSDPRTILGFELPKSDMGEDPFEAFKKFYRIYPHFSRVEL